MTDEQKAASSRRRRSSRRQPEADRLGPVTADHRPGQGEPPSAGPSDAPKTTGSAPHTGAESRGGRRRRSRGNRGGREAREATPAIGVEPVADAVSGGFPSSPVEEDIGENASALVESWDTRGEPAEFASPPASAAGPATPEDVPFGFGIRDVPSAPPLTTRGDRPSVFPSRPHQPPPTPSPASRSEPTTVRAETLSPTTEAAAPPRPATKPRGRGRGERGSGRGAATQRRPHPAEAEGLEIEEPVEAAPEKPGTREMLINVSGRDECRIAILHEGRLEELFIERASTQSHVGNIYKGRVTNVEPSIQAAFIDFGLAQNGFLHISDVQPQYFPDHRGDGEDVGRKIPRHSRPPIQRCFRRGQEVIVQVTKEGLGTKGPTLTTYLSIPGRFLVMMPGMNRHGVSRKIEDEIERRKAKDALQELELPTGMGFILRTAGLGRSKRELQRDLHYLTRLWKTVAERIRRMPAPAELYQESDLVTRTIRDVYTSDFKRVMVDDAETAKRAREFFQLAMPRARTPVEHYTEREPLFHRLGVEQEIEKIHSRHVPLPSGGSLVIDSTEALVAIDVNSGRSRVSDDAEEMAYRINLEAAEEIARQLRLRDLGGLILCDFIDLRADRHKRAVERALRDALKKHKERARILRMSAFGIIEMTRQRQGPSLKRNIYYDCPHCKGSGLVKMPDSVVLDVLRIIQLATNHPQVHKVYVTVSNEVAYILLNAKRAAIQQIEAETRKSVVVKGDATFTSDQVDYRCEDSRGRPADVLPSHALPAAPRHAERREAPEDGYRSRRPSHGNRPPPRT